MKRDALKIFSFKDYNKIDKCKYISRLANPDVFGQISHRPGSYDLDRIASRVADIYEIGVDDIISLKSKLQKRWKPGAFFVFGRFENCEGGPWSQYLYLPRFGKAYVKVIKRNWKNRIPNRSPLPSLKLFITYSLLACPLLFISGNAEKYISVVSRCVTVCSYYIWPIFRYGQLSCVKLFHINLET